MPKSPSGANDNREHESNMSPQQLPRSHRIILALLLMMVLFFTKTTVGSSNDYSRLSTVESLVRYHTFIVQPPSNARGDMIYDGTHWFSDKPPLLAVMTAPVLQIILWLNPDASPAIDLYPNSTYYLLSLFFSGLPYLVIVYLLYLQLRRKKYPTSDTTLLLLTISLCSLLLPYATIYSNHVISALLLLLSFLSLQQWQAEKKNIWLTCAAVSLSLLVGLDLIAGIVAIAATYAINILSSRQDRVLFFLTLLPGLGLVLLLNYLTTGGIIPMYMLRNVYQTLPENSWRTDITQLSIQSLLYQGVSALFSWPKGLLLITPLWCFSWWYAARQFFRDIWERWIVLVSVFSLGLMIAASNDLGGSAFGLRWSIVLIPLWLWVLIQAWNKLPQLLKMLFIICLLASAILAFQGLIDPWQYRGNFTLGLMVLKSL